MFHVDKLAVLLSPRLQPCSGRHHSHRTDNACNRRLISPRERLLLSSIPHPALCALRVSRLRQRKSVERNARFQVLEFRSTGASASDGWDARLQLLCEGDVITANHDPHVFLNSLPLLVIAARVREDCSLPTLVLSHEDRGWRPARTGGGCGLRMKRQRLRRDGETGADGSE